jgi:hypothetical protein
MSLSVPHWDQSRTIRLAESKYGVRVTCSVRENLVYPADAEWPPPALRKKLGGGRWTGASPEDDRAPRDERGKYCALQSLNSEDAVTWSVFGALSRLPAPDQADVLGQLFSLLELPPPASEAEIRF